MPRSPSATLLPDLPPRSGRLLPAPDAGADPPRRLDFSRLDHLGLSDQPFRRGALACRGRDCVQKLNDRLAAFCDLPRAFALPTVEAALQAALGSWIGPGDRVLLDAGSAPAVIRLLRATGAELLRCPPGSVTAVERRLQRLSRQPRRGRLILCLPAVSELASVAADLADLVPLAASHGAILAIDASQDFGTIAQCGRGLPELQGCIGQTDILFGSLVGATGLAAGFAAFRAPGPDLTASPALGPAQAATLLSALDQIDSTEGQRRRRRLHGNCLRLRNHLMADGFRVLGQPSPLVPVLLPPGRDRAMAALLASAGPTVPLVTAPQVGSRSPRWLIRLSADHDAADIDNLADLIREVDQATRAQRRPAPSSPAQSSPAPSSPALPQP
jgi:7-keto-8-aminopelargonate synthetase-like enzyme